MKQVSSQTGRTRLLPETKANTCGLNLLTPRLKASAQLCSALYTCRYDRSRAPGNDLTPEILQLFERTFPEIPMSTPKSYTVYSKPMCAVYVVMSREEPNKIALFKYDLTAFWQMLQSRLQPRLKATNVLMYSVKPRSPKPLPQTPDPVPFHLI